MNKKRLLAMVVAGTMVVGSAAALAGCGGKKGTSVLVWVSETEGVKTLTEQQVKTFLENNEEYNGKYNITVQGMTEGESATQMVTDVASGPDIFCYAQDQMARLVEAKALSALGSTSAQWVKDNNDAGSVKAVTVNDTLYSYPITSDNTYFMYYDKSVISEDHIGDLEAIVDDCKAAGKNFSFYLEGSAWYTASFFFGAGCNSSWNYDDTTGRWTAYDTINSDEGLIALKGMQILTDSGVYVDSQNASDFGAATPSAVVVSGTWDAKTAADLLGDNLGVAKLPSYRVDGKTYQLTSFFGYKLMGVKPQTDSAKAEFCHKLAQYLSGEECQQARLDQFGWGPSNKNAAASDSAKASPILKAVLDQAQYAVPQGQIHGGWWDLAAALGATKGKTVEQLQGMLETYQAGIDKFESMTEEEMNAFGVIGSIASLVGSTGNVAQGEDATWASWGTDLKMNKVEEDDKVVWTSVIPVALAAGDEFQVRKGQSWDTQYGAVNPETGFSTTSNFVITAENAGTYYIVLTVTNDGATVSLQAAE